jgi:hypothetical protein
MIRIMLNKHYDHNAWCQMIFVEHGLRLSAPIAFSGIFKRSLIVETRVNWSAACSSFEGGLKHLIRWMRLRRPSSGELAASAIASVLRGLLEAGGMQYPAVTMAIRRLAKRLETDKALTRKVKRVKIMLFVKT